MKKLLFPLVFALYVFPPAVTAQVRCGMVTEPLETPDEFGQRAFLTYRAGDPYAADIPRDGGWYKAIERGYPLPPSSPYVNVIEQVDYSLLRCFPRDEILALGSLFRVEYRPGIREHNYRDVMPFRLWILFTVDRDGRGVSVAFEYPDIPDYRRIRPRTWRKLERILRKRIRWDSSSSEEKSLSHYLVFYEPDWFADLRHYLITGQEVIRQRWFDRLL